MSDENLNERLRKKIQRILKQISDWHTFRKLIAKRKTANNTIKPHLEKKPNTNDVLPFTQDFFLVFDKKT